MDIQPASPTYASAAGGQRAARPPPTRSSLQPSVKHESKRDRILVVSCPAAGSEPEAVKAAAYAVINPAETQVRISALITGKSGRIIARFADRSDRDKAQRLISADPSEIEAREPAEVPVKLFLPGVPSTLCKESLLPALVGLNPHLTAAAAETTVQGLTVPKEGQTEVCAFLLVTQKFADEFLKSRLYVGRRSVWCVRSTSNPRPRCGGCGRVGHTTRKCTDEFKASAAALGDETCVNCTDFNLKSKTGLVRDANHLSAKFR